MKCENNYIQAKKRRLENDLKQLQEKALEQEALIICANTKLEQISEVVRSSLRSLARVGDAGAAGYADMSGEEELMTKFSELQTVVSELEYHINMVSARRQVLLSGESSVESTSDAAAARYGLAPTDLIFPVHAREETVHRLLSDCSTLYKELYAGRTMMRILTQEEGEHKQEIAFLKAWIENAKSAKTVQRLPSKHRHSGPT
jgi:hypothetical protein